MRQSECTTRRDVVTRAHKDRLKDRLKQDEVRRTMQGEEPPRPEAGRGAVTPERRPALKRRIQSGHLWAGVVAGLLAAAVVSLPFLMVADRSMWPNLRDPAFLRVALVGAYQRDPSSFVVIPGAVLVIGVVVALCFRALNRRDADGVPRNGSAGHGFAVFGESRFAERELVEGGPTETAVEIKAGADVGGKGGRSAPSRPSALGASSCSGYTRA